VPLVPELELLGSEAGEELDEVEELGYVLGELEFGVDVLDELGDVIESELLRLEPLVLSSRPVGMID